jgi:acetyl-CoA C-acetyltransferase
MSAPRVYVLGGWQTDFSRNFQREGQELFDVLRETALEALARTGVAPEAIDCAHVGNFTAELFCRQGHLGGLLAAADPAFAGLPIGRHEAACASGSIAALAASAELEAGRYGMALVVGVEQMRNVPGATAAEYIGAPAMWSGHEATDVPFPWPHQFARLGDEYDRRYGLKQEHLAAIARLNFDNARRNPNAQTRAWTFEAESFSEDDARNPVIDGRIRKQDCGQITDGAAIVFLANEPVARAWAARNGARPGRSTSRGCAAGATARRRSPTPPRSRPAADAPYVFPWVRATIEDAFRRARLPGRRGGRRRRDPRLLHHHRVHGDRPLRHHGAGARAGRRSSPATSRSVGGSR